MQEQEKNFMRPRFFYRRQHNLEAGNSKIDAQKASKDIGLMKQKDLETNDEIISNMNFYDYYHIVSNYLLNEDGTYTSPNGTDIITFIRIPESFNEMIPK